MMPGTQLDPFDFDALQVASAMYGSPQALFTKLIDIWELSRRMIVASERKHPAPLKKLWRSDAGAALGARSLGARASIAEQRGFFHQHYDDGFAFAYFGVLKEASRIERALCSSGSGPSGGEVSVRERLAEILSKNSSHKFLNDVVVHFFPLQLHCYHLVRILESPTGIPPDPLARRKRSVVGGEASNVGERELKEDVMRFLEGQHVDVKYTSVATLFEALNDGLEKTLRNYQARLGRTSMRSNGRVLTYGRNLKTDGLLRRISAWKKDDPEFGAVIERICVVRRYSSPN